MGGNSTNGKMQNAAGAAPSRETSAAAAAAQNQPPMAEFRSSGVTAFPTPPQTITRTESGHGKPERVVITSDQLVAAVHGKLQQAADKAVHTAINSHLMDAVRQALTKIDDVCKSSVSQMEQHTTQQMDGMMESVRQEVLKRMDARLAEDRLQWEQDQQNYRARAEEGSANNALEEFKRQIAVHSDLAISDSTQRLMSSLASLDAENRAACEARRMAIESEVAQATQQSTEQFRTGIKAFLYSCLVAAVGAVDQHAQTTLDSLKDPAKVLRQLSAAAGASHATEQPAQPPANTPQPQGQ
jgi:hypothetical protein